MIEAVQAFSVGPSYLIDIQRLSFQRIALAAPERDQLRNCLAIFCAMSGALPPARLFMITLI